MICVPAPKPAKPAGQAGLNCTSTTSTHETNSVAIINAVVCSAPCDCHHADLIELMCSSDAAVSPLVSVLGGAVREECEANARRGGQTVGNRFSQQVRRHGSIVCVAVMRCVRMNALVHACVQLCTPNFLACWVEELGSCYV